MSQSLTVTTATFVYDGDGKRVKSTLNSVDTYFVGAHYEVANGVITKYYYAGSQRIAMRSGGALYYLLGDHLGSTSLVTDANGQNPIETRYKAWGEVRHASGAMPTQYTFTGQYSYANDFGLMYYGARWYDSSLGRFSQPDTIIPPTQGIQAWDRYAYSNNNPVRYTDLSGHCAVSFILGLFGISYSCPAPLDSGSWIDINVAVKDEGEADIFLPVSEGGGLDIFVPVSEDNLPDIFVPVSDDNWIEGFDPVNENTLQVDASDLGDLTDEEADQIQEIVNAAGRPLEVIGSAARGERRNAGTNLPLGKDKNERSDIDYIIPYSSKEYYLENGLYELLPDIDPEKGPNFGTHNPFIGPAIRFEPYRNPYFIPQAV